MSTETEKVEVFKFWLSGPANRVLIALEEMGVPYIAQEEDLKDKSSKLLQANPIHKKVPTIIHKGKPLAESLIILEYIDDTWSSSAAESLLPVDSYDRAIARFWAEFMDNEFRKAGSDVIVSEGKTQEEAKKEFIDSFLLIEEAFMEISRGKHYFGGDTFGYLDIVFVPYVPLWPSVEVLGNFRLPIVKCPNLSASINIVMKRESVKKILPTPEAAIEFFNDYRKTQLSKSK